MTRRRGFFLLTGWLVLGAALSPPFDAAADRGLLAHMLQHALLLAVAAPLLALGEPVRVALDLLPPRQARRLARLLRARPARVLLAPATALALFAGLVLATHLPAVYDACLQSDLLHGLEHLAYLAAGLLLWSAIVGSDPTAKPLSLVGVTALITAAMVPMLAVGIALATASHVLYPAYLAHAPAATVLAEQATAATAMWAGDLPFAAALVLAGWASLRREERRQRLRERALIALLLAAAIAIWAVPSPRSSAQPAAAADRAGAAAPAATAQPVPAGAAAAGAESPGRRLFVQGCSSCHGYDATGVAGSGPSLVGAGAAAADFYLRTGRMPLDRPDEEPLRGSSPYTPAQVRALVAYVGSLGGPPIPAVHAASGDQAAGQKLFTEHCAGCHQVVGQGGIMPGAVAPSFGETSPIDVAEAVRIGPYAMPTFGHLSQGEVDDIAHYVDSTHDPEDRGGWGLGHLGPIPEGMVAWLLAGAALVLAIRLIGERTEP